MQRKYQDLSPFLQKNLSLFLPQPVVVVLVHGLPGGAGDGVVVLGDGHGVGQHAQLVLLAAVEQRVHLLASLQHAVARALEALERGPGGVVAVPVGVHV